MRSYERYGSAMPNGRTPTAGRAAMLGLMVLPLVLGALAAPAALRAGGGPSGPLGVPAAGYSVTFNESGLGSAYNWSVTVSGTEKQAPAGSSIGFSGLSGTNAYTVPRVIVSNQCGLRYYEPSPSAGNLTGSGHIAVTFTYKVLPDLPACVG